MKKVTLSVHGRERTFSEQELIDILEKHFPKISTEQVSTAKVVEGPIEDQWFEVNPLGIDQKLFQNWRKDVRQEKTRQLILEAFVELKKKPKKYGKSFKTMMPRKTWEWRSAKSIKEMTCRWGDHMANWVEQALEWAQRIANGESWETICNKADTAYHYRLVVWKDGYMTTVGGAIYNGWRFPPSYVWGFKYEDWMLIQNSVPLVVIYEK